MINQKKITWGIVLCALILLAAQRFALPDGRLGRTVTVDTTAVHALQDTSELERQLTVDINTADAAELQRIKGVGPALAEAILKRRQQGAFVSVEQLLEVPGIGAGTLETMRPYLRLK